MRDDRRLAQKEHEREAKLRATQERDAERADEERALAELEALRAQLAERRP